MKKLRGKLTITTPSSSNRPNSWVSITVEDESSHCQFLEIEVSYEELAKALTGRGYRPCEFKFNEDAPIGKTVEVKKELVHYEGSSSKKDEALRQKAVEPFEVDGWACNPDDLLNHHNHRGDKNYAVTFRRYV